MIVPWLTERTAGPPTLLVVAALVLVGCQQVRGPSTPRSVSELPNGWHQVGEIRTFGSETIFQLVDGQAEAYFAYNFEEVSVQTYENVAGARVDVEVWRVTAANDAYGLFSSYRAGEAISVGNSGDEDPGRRLAFWKDTYFVRMRARQPIASDSLRDLAASMAAALPDGGTRPALVGALPTRGLIRNSEIYFHLEQTIQDKVWLGDTNVLGLDLGTEGVLGSYEFRGTIAHLVLVDYEEAGAATTALEKLLSASVDTLVAADGAGNRLAAVFGSLARTEGERLITEALQGG